MLWAKKNEIAFVSRQRQNKLQVNIALLYIWLAQWQNILEFNAFVEEEKITFYSYDIAISAQEWTYSVSN